ncbi:MAG: ROK family protein [Propioniciclava sp.]
MSVAVGSDGLRQQTRRAIYDLVAEQELATKNEIAHALELSLPTVTKYLTHFLDEGLLQRGAKRPSGVNGGRAPVGYRCVPDGRLAVGVDITAEGATTLLVDLQRTVRGVRRAARPFVHAEEYFAFIGAEVTALLRDNDVDPARLLGVGVAMPGLISRTRQVVTYGRVLDNRGVSATDFSRHIPYPTRIVHDSDAAGLAEFWPDQSVQNAFYVSLSRSVGGSVLIGGEVYLGDGEFAGEVGHVELHPEGDQCYCGEHGCMDAYCNAGVLSRHTDGVLADFFLGLDRGDPALGEVWNRYTSDLARAIVDIRLMFGGTVILGGDVGAYLHQRMEPIWQRVADLHFLTRAPAEFLMACTNTNEPIATGAALEFVRAFHAELRST